MQLFVTLKGPENLAKVIALVMEGENFFYLNHKLI